MYLSSNPEDDRLPGSTQTRVYALKDNVRSIWSSGSYYILLKP